MPVVLLNYLKYWLNIKLRVYIFIFIILAYIKKILTMQIKLLNKGLIIPAMEVQNTMSGLIAEYSNYESIPEDSIGAITIYEEMADDGECH